jgi:hypothetical protein
MATKPQAKTAIDAAVTQVKADIDTIIPTSPAPNIRRGAMSFAPNAWTFVLDAGGSLSTATSWRDTILANLALADRPVPPASDNKFQRRQDDGEPEKAITISSGPSTFKIVNFPNS